MMKPWYRRGLATIGTLLILVLLLPGSSPSQANAESSYGESLTILGADGVPGILNCNPFLPGESLTGTQGMIYETLLFFNQMQGGKITPWLATGYRFSSDATSLTFTLRSGVKWSDGQDFTSADVVFTLTLLKRYPVLDTAGLWKVITSVSAPDKQTVVVTFNQPSVPILWPLAGQTFIVPEHLWKNVADPTTYDNPRPVGTGPFLLKGLPRRWSTCLPGTRTTGSRTSPLSLRSSMNCLMAAPQMRPWCHQAGTGWVTPSQALSRCLFSG